MYVCVCIAISRSVGMLVEQIRGELRTPKRHDITAPRVVGVIIIRHSHVIVGVGFRGLLAWNLDILLR